MQPVDLCLNEGAARSGAMSPAYDLILERDGQLTTHTVEVADALEAWRLARARYPSRIRGVVWRDPQQVRADHPR
ncbi:hypothetical protein [Synechococcus sp. BMK-MC-1]|uniref:hypothetical protein n=1 Tax=Synechococcus sp. BMK-MC-1 TaxID=1442551 RepID=UPI001647D875|nr:hypothetical protein [Synechococcus sp. BMK-MC-1]QNI67239.1 hypothetical protein SynBMKMC1_01156 [Synechococcus sp. BMK-MC-1]